MGGGPTSAPIVWGSGLSLSGLGPQSGATAVVVPLEGLASDGMSDPAKPNRPGGRPFHFRFDKDRNGKTATRTVWLDPFEVPGQRFPGPFNMPYLWAALTASSLSSSAVAIR
jgi:hypothetical protein